MTARERFLSKVEAFLEESGMSASRLGKDALNDANFVFHLRNDTKTTTLATVDVVLGFMATWRRARSAQVEGEHDDERQSRQQRGGAAA